VWEWNGAYNEGKAKRVENGIDNVLETEFDPWEFDDTKDMVIP
jgi:murein tripeptide amidase MpaA